MVQSSSASCSSDVKEDDLSYGMIDAFFASLDNRGKSGSTPSSFGLTVDSRLVDFYFERMDISLFLGNIY